VCVCARARARGFFLGGEGGEVMYTHCHIVMNRVSKWGWEIGQVSNDTKMHFGIMLQYLATIFPLEVLGMYDHCYCLRLPGNSEVSLAVMMLPAADSWLQGLEAQTAKHVIHIVPL